MYSSYDGPLYKLIRRSDGKELKIGVAQPQASTTPDAGGYAATQPQRRFCANTTCWITKLYDQSPNHNDLTQAPRGRFSGPALGGMDNLPIADMAPVLIGGHEVYGVFIEPGMGLRNDAPKGTAVDDQSQGQYWVVSGTHYNDGCCFDFGNAEIDSFDDGNGTMETTYFGNSAGTYFGEGAGPWIMTDQENNLVGCINPGDSKFCPDLPAVPWRFVTATASGEPHHWRAMGGDAQSGDLSVMFSGPRVNATYDPMRKQGAILLGDGGDNSNDSQGTFYEGAMTAAGTFPTQAAQQRMQANVVAARYQAFPLSIGPTHALAEPPGLQTFSPGSSNAVTLSFTNTTDAPVRDVKLMLSVPSRQWSSVVAGATKTSRAFTDPVAPGDTVSATFHVTTDKKPLNADLVGRAEWKDAGRGTVHSVVRAERVRNVQQIRIHQFRISTSSPMNATNSFIELHNAGDHGVDISDWTLTAHPIQQPVFSRIKVPSKTKIPAHGFYVLGLSNSGLAAAASKGDRVIHVRSTAGMKVGDTVTIGFGSSAETRKIAAIGTAASRPTTVWQPLPDGIVDVPAGATNILVHSVSGFTLGQKLALGHGANHPAVPPKGEKYEVVTVTKIGTPATHDYLSADAKAGATSIKVKSVKNISAGDQIRLDIESAGHGVETVTVKQVDRSGKRLVLTAPLRFNHADNLPFSDRGTGISFKPATDVVHSSDEPVWALGSGVELTHKLARNHAINAVVHDAKVKTVGYQGTREPDQWFGGPVLHGLATPGRTGRAGSMVLRDASAVVVDSLNYGRVVDPWVAEGYQGKSGKGQRGCRAPAPESADGRGISAVRIQDTDSNCDDFRIRPTRLSHTASSR